MKSVYSVSKKPSTSALSALVSFLEMMSLFIDADSLPKREREILLRRIRKEGLEAYFVADRILSDVRLAIEEDTADKRSAYRDILPRKEMKKIKSGIHMIVVATDENSADDEIVRIAETPSLAITHDIPLAKRLIDKGITVMDDRGHELGKDNINERLSMRSFMQDLRESGFESEKTKALTERDIANFSNTLDRLIMRLKKAPDCGK